MPYALMFQMKIMLLFQLMKPLYGTALIVLLQHDHLTQGFFQKGRGEHSPPPPLALACPPLEILF